MGSVLAVIGLFILRLGVPIAFMVLLSWAVNWYVRREEERALEAEQRAAIAKAVPAAPKQCWDIKGCTEEAKSDCAAVRRPDLPCWLAKQLSTGRLSPTCQNCAMYKKSAAAAVSVRA